MLINSTRKKKALFPEKIIYHEAFKRQALGAIGDRELLSRLVLMCQGIISNFAIALSRE